MVRHNSINTLCRVLALGTAMTLLSGCGMFGRNDGPAPSSVVSSAATELSPELQARFEGLLPRVRANDTAAIRDMEAFSAQHPDLSGPLVSLGLARLRAGDDVGARQYLEQATTVCGRCGSAWNELGIVHRQNGRFAEAEKAYQRAIDLEPRYSAPYYNLAILYELYLSQPQLALQNYEEYLQLNGAADEGQLVEKWVTDLRRRVGQTAKTARAEGAS